MQQNLLISHYIFYYTRVRLHILSDGSDRISLAHTQKHHTPNQNQIKHNSEGTNSQSLDHSDVSRIQIDTHYYYCFVCFVLLAQLGTIIHGEHYFYVISEIELLLAIKYFCEFFIRIDLSRAKNTWPIFSFMAAKH